MFILSAGMPKSGSTLLSLYQRDILIAGRRDNGQLEFERQIMDGRISGIGIFVHELERSNILEDLVKLSSEIGPFVVKTHSSLTSGLRKHILNKDIIVTYIHRDPRDVILSAIDHGKRPVKNPFAGDFFRQFSDVEHSIPIVKEFCRIGLEWINFELCLVFSYAELLLSPEDVSGRFSRLVGVDPEPKSIRDMITSYSVNKQVGKRQFNTGKLTRYKEEMTAQEISLCNHELADEILLFGYEI